MVQEVADPTIQLDSHTKLAGRGVGRFAIAISQSRNLRQPMGALIRGTSSHFGCHCVSEGTDGRQCLGRIDGLARSKLMGQASLNWISAGWDPLDWTGERPRISSKSGK